MKKLSYTVMILCTLAFNVWAFGELSLNQKLSVKKDNANLVVIDVGAGSLNVRGADIDEVSVSAKIHSKEYKDIDALQEAFENKMVFELQHKGSIIVFKALEKKKMLSFSSSDISIDIEMVIPRSMNLEIDDGSGSMEVTNIDGSLNIDDGSGSIEISHIKGDLHIDDGSGSLDLRNVGGSVFLNDSSGGVDIQGVAGDVTVDDGSGSINITELKGNFHLEDDGSGQIHVNGKKWIVD